MSGPNKSEKGAVFVALFSGINVGGNRIVKMAELKSFFEGLGFTDVATYVQSGNVVFRAKKGDAASLTKQLEAAFEKKWGFNSRIMVRDAGWFVRCEGETEVEFTIGFDLRSAGRSTRNRAVGHTKNWWKIQAKRDELKIIAIREARLRE